MALSKSKKMAKERERLFQEAKEKAKRQISKKGNRFGVPVEVLPKDYIEDMGRQTRGWSSFHIERAGSTQSGYIKLITGEEK
jgi:hypothetical protein